MEGVEGTIGEEWDHRQNNNSKGVFGNKALIPGLMGSRFSAYGDSKGLVRTLTKSRAVNHGYENIRCNSVHPGIIDTDVVSEMIGSREGQDFQLNRTPLKATVNSKDVGGSVFGQR
ncbi:MAG: NAD(P)-dependent dehydrogenase, short-chain alcohol dehydrogenase family [Chloroflexi bacterium]|nr:MAG: NAD(P)-dependent dehydrogenase, short-chain alcohol dehydrogenase family [Chloroflexota bacterium]